MGVVSKEVRLTKLLEGARAIAQADEILRSATEHVGGLGGAGTADEEALSQRIAKALVVQPDLTRKAKPIVNYVVGGTRAGGAFPEVVALKHAVGFNCSGVIVGARWIMTAAHCVIEAPSVAFIGDDVNGRGKGVNLKCRVVVENEVALVQISDNEQDLPAPFAVMGASQPLPDTSATIVGFGFQDARRTVGLGEKSVGVVTIKKSTATVIKSRGGAYDTCDGDSGGPCYVVENNSMVLAGITNEGITVGNCGAGSEYRFVNNRVISAIQGYLAGTSHC